MDIEEIIKMRDTFQEFVNITNEVIALDERDKKGEDVTKEMTASIGRMAIIMTKLNNL